MQFWVQTAGPGRRSRKSSPLARHEVVAIARKLDAIPAAAGVKPGAGAGDASDPEALAGLIRGQDAVTSALHFNVTADILLLALKQAGVTRLLVSGDAASLETGPGKRVIDAPDFPEGWKTAAMGGIALDTVRGLCLAA